MRLLELKQSLLEGRTIAKGIETDKKRADFFFGNIRNKIPFPVEPSKKDPNPRPIVVDPKQLPELQRAYNAKAMTSVVLKGLDGREVKLNHLVKTAGLGTKEAEKVPVKPSALWGVKGQEDIDPTEQNLSMAELKNLGAFPLRDLNSKIQENTALDQAGKVGQAIKEIAQQIENGEDAVIPDYLTPAEVKAIELYASEYLGILSLYNGRAEFPNKADFDKFLGTDLGGLMLYFPYSVSNQLGDSFAVKNKANGHTLIMSSKAGNKGGAAPSVTGLKIPDYIKEDPKFAKEVEFLEIIQNKQISGKTYPFALMNWMFENVPDTIDERFYPYLPWSQEWVDAIVEGIAHNDKFPKNDMNVFVSTLARGRSENATDAGIIWYATVQAVLKAINQNNALPNINAVILEILGYNFLQVYTKIVKNKLTTKIFWPAKITGKIAFENKYGAPAAGAGKISFRVSPN